MSAGPRATLRALVAFAGLLLSTAALACPYCAAKDDGGHRTLYFIGSMVALPFGVAAVTIRAIRRADQPSDHPERP